MPIPYHIVGIMRGGSYTKRTGKILLINFAWPNNPNNEGSDTIRNRVDGFMNLTRNLRILPRFWNLES